VYNVWLVKSSTFEPLTLWATYDDPHECLAFASMAMRDFGAVLLQARNITDPWDRGDTVPSMLVYDPTLLLPLSMLVEGACLCEEGLPLPPGQGTDAVAMSSPGPEFH